MTGRPGVHLATVHRVKGREWPRVVVFGADAGLFPHRLADDVEEERRIFHVAITRAARDGRRPGRRRRPVAVPGRAGRPRRAAGGEGAAGAQDAARAGDAGGGGVAAVGRPEGVADGHRPPRQGAAVRRHERRPLKGIAERRPSTLGELAACPGIGPLKLERYGEDILGVIEELRVTAAR